MTPSNSTDLSVPSDWEAILRESEDRFRAGFDYAPIGMALVATDGRWLRVNQSLCRILGYSMQELLGTDFQTLTHPDDLDTDLNFVRQMLAGSLTHYEMDKRYLHKDGRTIWILLSVSLVWNRDRQPLYFISQIQDVTARKELEQQLRASDERLRTIADNVPVCIGYVDVQERLQFANRAFLQVAGFSADYSGMLLRDFLGESAYAASADAAQRALHGERVTYLRDVVIDAQRRQQQVTYLPDLDESGLVKGFYGLTYDVTEFTQLNAELRQAQADLEAVLNNVPAIIGYWHKDYTSRFANRAYEETFGLPPGGMRGRHVREVLGGATYAASEAHMEATLAGEAQTFERATTRADGSVRHMHLNYVPDRRDGEVAGLYVLAVDITELNDSRERVRSLAQRLESAQEDERQSLALRLHEGIAQDLFVTKLSVDYLKTQAGGRAGVSEACAELTVQIDNMLNQVRHISHELRPDALSHARLAQSLDHLKPLGEHVGLRVEITEALSFPELPEIVRTIFFRAAQEALRNTIRHAYATLLSITLSANADRISMTIEDDGVGITDGDLCKPGSLGLVGIEERFKAFRGGTSVSNGQLRGAVLIAYVPADVADAC